MLFCGNSTTMALSLTIGQQYVSTSELYFSKVSGTKEKLVYRLELDSLSHIDYIYTLKPDSYLMDFDIQMEGMEKYIPKNTTQIVLDWAIDIRRQEKGYDNEKNYSSMSFKYPDTEKVENFGQRKPKAEKDVTTKFQWVAFQQQFFSTILIAKDNFSGGKLNMEFYPETDENRNLMRCAASAQIPFDGFNPSKNIGLQLYIGPNKFKILESYNLGFEKIVPLGGRLVSWINRWIIIPTFDFMSKYISNYGLIILLLTILLKLVTSPLLIKSYKSSAKMRILKPEIEKINEKYPNKKDEMKKQQATMDLYRRGDVSMMGGCLPVLFQMPVLFAMFRFFPVSFELRQQGFLWAEDLSGYDSILDLPFKIPMYGDHISLFGLLVAITMYFYSKTSIDSSPNQMPGMKGMMLYFMPLMMLVFCNNFSSALCYYYLITNLITILLTWLVRKYGVDADKLLKMVHDRENEPPKKSKWQLRLEEMQKIQQQQMAQRKKR